MKLNVDRFVSHFVNSRGSRSERIRQLIEITRKHGVLPGLTLKAVDKWHERKAVPSDRLIAFQELANQIGKPIRLEDFKARSIGGEPETGRCLLPPASLDEEAEPQRTNSSKGGKGTIPMSRKLARHLLPGEGSSDNLTPSMLTKKEFARRLTRLREDRNMSQADLARAAFGTIKDKQGRTVAKGRDSVSSYERARTFPNLKNLNKLADALKVEVADLRPNTVASVNDTDVPALELKQVPGQPDRAWLRVNRLMSLEAASKILIVVQEDEKARGNRSN